MTLSNISFRTKVLTTVGGSRLVTAWANSKSEHSGVRVRRTQGGLELRKGDRAILLAPKHAFFAPAVALAFDAYAYALPTEEREGAHTADFAAAPEAFNLTRAVIDRGGRVVAKDGAVWLHKDNRVIILAQHHFVYALDMTEKFDLYFSPLIPEDREGLQVVDYSTSGQLQTYKSGLQFEMASFPEEEEAIEEYFKWYRPQAGDLVFDMGAHCGVSTYHLSKLVGESGKVVAFEPDPVNYEILKRNIDRHGLTNVIAERAAIAGMAGKLGFNSEGSIGSSLQSLLLRDSVGSTVMVEAITLADTFERWGTPAFCKIDIEGAEIDVLTNSAEVLKKHPTHFALDTNHPMANGEMTSGEVEQIFKSYGYEVMSEANPLLTTWARPR